MSFRNGDKARSGRLRKERNAKRVKTRALREGLNTQAPAGGDTVVKKAARKIGSALGSIASATHLAGHAEK